MAPILNHLKWIYRELGLRSLHTTGMDAYLIILSRSTRMLAYGTNSLILALFFSALKFSDTYIGLFMTLTLLGDLFLSLGLTMVADRVGRRKVLFLGSFLMVLSGATFALAENFWLLLGAAVIGVISATGSDFGPFRAIEESTLSHLSRPETRADVLAWYVTTASLGSSAGTEVAGRIVNNLHVKRGNSLLEAYHVVFWMYSGMGVVNMVITLLLSGKCEVDANTKNEETVTSEEAGVLLDEMQEDSVESGDEGHFLTIITPSTPPELEKKSMFSQISKETRGIMYKLWILLTIDSLADGMTGYSLTVYFMDQKFHLPKSTLGDITSISYLLSSCSTIFAGPLSRHLGLINTMVFTHLPSSTAVLLFPFPTRLYLTIALFFLRTGLNNMDQAPRSAFIAAVVKPEERTAVMGITTMLRTLAATAGPTVTGILAGNGRFWIAFVVAGSLRIAYDMGLWALFINVKLYKHEEGNLEDGKGERMREGDEEVGVEMQKGSGSVV